MGKASRKKKTADKVVPAPFVARPFEGLASETDLVALRELIPAGTARLRLIADDAALAAAMEAAGVDAGVVAARRGSLPKEILLSTVLPMAWPGLHRADGTVMVGLQSGSTSGDVSRDLANVALRTMAEQPGTPVPMAPVATFTTPRLQDIVDTSAPVDVELHTTFDFWLADDAELDAEGRESLDRANATIIPTHKISDDSAYWFRVGERVFLRYLLPHDEGVVTDGLARLHAADTLTLGEGTRFLGAFRACGLLVPVWELDAAKEAPEYTEPVARLAKDLAAAMESTAPLSSEERRAKAGIVSRQLTLR